MAAIGLLAIVWGAALLRPRSPGGEIAIEKPPIQELAEVEPAPETEPVNATPLAPHVALADPSSGILVAKTTKSPNVSIVWVYPTVNPNPEGGEVD